MSKSSQAESRDDLNQVVPEGNGVPGLFGSGGRPGALGRLQVSPEALRSLPADFVKRHQVLPFKISDGTLHIATAAPGNQRVIDDIRLLSGLEVQEAEAAGPEVLEKIAECYQVTVEQMIENLHPDRATTVESKNLHDIEVMANEPTVITWLISSFRRRCGSGRATSIWFLSSKRCNCVIGWTGCCRRSRRRPSSFTPRWFRA